MPKKSLNECKSGKDFVDYSVKQGARVRYGHGSHQMVITSKGATPIPVHGNHDLGTGLRHNIIKTLLTLGISCVLLFLVISNLVS